MLALARREEVLDAQSAIPMEGRRRKTCGEREPESAPVKFAEKGSLTHEEVGV